MERSDILLTIAEIAVALTGFAGIVVLFLRGEGDRWLQIDIIRFGSMIASSLGALLFALLPLPFFEAGVSESTVWVTCSLAFAVYGTIFGIAGFRATVRQGRTAFNPYLLALVAGGSLVAAVLLLLNAFGVVFQRSFTGYLIGLLWFVAVAAVFFSRLVYLGVRERLSR